MSLLTPSGKSRKENKVCHNIYSPLHRSITAPHACGHVMLHTWLTQRHLSLALFIVLIYPQCNMFCWSELFLRAVCLPRSFRCVQVDQWLWWGGETGVPTSIPSKAGLSPVGPDAGRVQWGEDVLDAFHLDHTLVPPPVLPWDRRQIQVHADLEGPVGVGEDLPMVHMLIKLLAVSHPEHHHPVRVEACSMAHHWGGGSPLEERHLRTLWREGGREMNDIHESNGRGGGVKVMRGGERRDK